MSFVEFWLTWGIFQFLSFPMTLFSSVTISKIFSFMLYQPSVLIQRAIQIVLLAFLSGSSSGVVRKRRPIEDWMSFESRSLLFWSTSATGGGME
jgi:hypothetical protein